MALYEEVSQRLTQDLPKKGISSHLKVFDGVFYEEVKNAIQ